MPEIGEVRDYFTRSAVAFDSLYELDRASPLMRYVNKKFRRDIYERFLLTLDHARKHALQSALDVGCGSGRYAYALAELGMRRIVGIDVSPSMIQLAREFASRLSGAEHRCEFLCGDFMEFRSPEQFDMVLAMGLFDYVSEPLGALRRMREYASHSVIASFPSISWYRTPIRKVRYYLKRCPVYFYRRHAIERLSREAGFADTQIVKIEGAGQDYVATFFNQ
jgi:SAM-dependent methyltransferase